MKFLTAALFIVSCAYPRAGESRPGRTPAEQVASAVKVTVVCAVGDQMFMAGGSGVIVEDFSVITANHVVECPGKLGIAIDDWRGNAYKAELLVGDEDEDVAKLYVPELKGSVVQYGPKPRIDERVCLVGASPYRVRRCGWVESWGPKPGDMKHSAITEPGNSGGAIYDSRGFLVGIVTHYRSCSNGQLCGGAATSFRGLL